MRVCDCRCGVARRNALKVSVLEHNLLTRLIQARWQYTSGPLEGHGAVGSEDEESSKMADTAAIKAPGLVSPFVASSGILWGVGEPLKNSLTC